MVNTCPRSQVQSGLNKKGFTENSADHYKYIYYTIAGKKTSIWTKISRGTNHKDISRDNLKRMASQCHLTLMEFFDLIKCPLSREDYELKLIKKKKNIF